MSTKAKDLYLFLLLKTLWHLIEYYPPPHHMIQIDKNLKVWKYLALAWNVGNRKVHTTLGESMNGHTVLESNFALCNQVENVHPL